MGITDIYEAMNRKAKAFFRVGAGSPAIRNALCGCSAWIRVDWIVVSMEMGVPLAIWRQTMDIRRLQTRNSPPHTDYLGQRGSCGQPYIVLFVEIAA